MQRFFFHSHLQFSIFNFHTIFSLSLPLFIHIEAMLRQGTSLK